MIRLILILLLFAGVVRGDFADDISLQSGDVIVVGGDSITDAKMYSHYLASWLHLTYPDLDLMIYPVGRPVHGKCRGNVLEISWKFPGISRICFLGKRKRMLFPKQIRNKTCKFPN